MTIETPPGRRATAGLLGLLLLAPACTLHVVDESPSTSVSLPSSYPSAPADVGPQGALATSPAPAAQPVPDPLQPPQLQPWWRDFDDPTLDALIRQALDGDFGVAQAYARLVAARARAVQAGASLEPMVDAFAGRSASNSGVSKVSDLDDGATDVAEVGLVAAWELDLFGRLAAERDAAEFDARAFAEDLAAVRLSLSAEVADTFYVSREQGLLLLLLEQQLGLDRTLLELTELRFAQGAASAVDVLQQQGQVAATESLMPAARAGRRLAENRLDVLLGVAPDGLDRVATHDFRMLPPLPAPGLPADLLLRRPDLRARLADVSARDYELAAGLADRLPQLFLFASLGGSSVDSSSGWTGSLGADLLAPLVDGGRRRAVVAERRALLDASLDALDAALLVAVEEVDGSLWLEQQQRDELEVLRRRARILEANVIEARNRYANGLTDYLPVLVAVDDVQQVQRDVLRRTRELHARRIALHRALGGSLPPLADDATAQTGATATAPATAPVSAPAASPAIAAREDDA